MGKHRSETFNDVHFSDLFLVCACSVLCGRSIEICKHFEQIAISGKWVEPDNAHDSRKVLLRYRTNSVIAFVMSQCGASFNIACCLGTTEVVSVWL